MSQISLYVTLQHQNILLAIVAINTLLTIEINVKLFKNIFSSPC